MSLARLLLRSSQKCNFVCNPSAFQLPLHKDLSSNAESFLCGANANFLEAQYLEWSKSKGSIDSSWDGFYDSLCGPALLIEDCSPKTAPQPPSGSRQVCGGPDPNVTKKIKLQMSVAGLIRAYQARGHLLAKIDPLGLVIPAQRYVENLRLDVKGAQTHVVCREMGSELTEEHMDMIFELPTATAIGGTETRLTLREIIRRLENTYCKHIGIEYMHLIDIDQVRFLRQKLEKPGAYNTPVEEKKQIMRRCSKGVLLEQYFASKWPVEKRFGLEGGESMIAMMEEIVDTSARLGVESIIIAMQHRGRLNMLVNVCRKQLCDVFAQFYPTSVVEDISLISGDIKYHFGTCIHRFMRRTSKYIKVSMCANPSHLEVVAPVALGKTRAEMFWKGDSTGDKVMGIIMHGDSAVCGQGVVYETLTMSNLPAFTTYGTLHIVCNNQIGYTTDPRFNRSTPYCSDVGKFIDAPILHVNADEPESVALVGRIAVEFRCKFKKDVFVDLVCYRRHGHSEEDEPMFTQPFMYKKIRTMKTINVIYADRLMKEGVFRQEEIKQWESEYVATLNKHFDMAKKITKVSLTEWIDTPWTGFFERRDPNLVYETGICQKSINTILKHFATPPEKWAFTVHPGIKRILENREKLIKDGLCDWPMGEALAFASLLRDNIHIRFTGQDVERGTLAARHHVYHNQEVDGSTYRVLDTVYPDQARYELHNSALSEMAPVGYEFGYSLTSPSLLNIWEAQFGDFADEAQPIIDTFVANAESKWINQSALVMQLPHGLDGGGPEHSSGRVERFLQASPDDGDTIPNVDDKNFELKQLRVCNWTICNLSSPANLFHLMRRQIALPFRKPLILLTPKIGLRHPFFRSKFCEFQIGTKFRRVIPESGPASKNPGGVKKLLFCSGNVAIKVDEVRKAKKLESAIAMCRIEQIYPFPYDLILKECCKYEKAKKVFLQEEHKNQGTWPFCRIRMENLLGKKIECIARPPSAASATGIRSLHLQEIKDLKDKIASGC